MEKIITNIVLYNVYQNGKYPMHKSQTTILVLLLLVGVNSLAIFTLPVSAAPEGWIDITWPAAGVSYWEGDEIYIQWDWLNAGNYVKVELYQGGDFYSTLTSNTSNDGYYTGDIPVDITTGTTYQVRIISLANSTIYDMSPYITIYDRKIEVTSPASGETWYKGNGYYIYWDLYEAGSYFDIELYKSGSKYQTIASDAYCPYGNYYWYIPETLSISSSYKIKVSSTYYDTAYDYSNTFSIDEKSITITSPIEDDEWFKGETYTITWDSHNAGNYVSIGYRYDTGYNPPPYSIVSNTSNDGSYSWTIPSGLASNSDYKIYIKSLSDSSVQDWSDAFSIDERLIIIIAPTSGTTWYINDSYTIRWSAENIGSSVKLSLYQEGWPVAAITTSTENDGEYSWQITNDILPSASCKLKVESTSYSSAYGISDYFSIDHRSITVHDPNEETWYVGETYTITWDSNGAGDYVDISLYGDGELYFTIAEQTENDGYYQWTIPSGLDSGSSYTIQISSDAYSGVSSTSVNEIAIQQSVLQQVSGTLPFIIAVILIITVSFVVYRKVLRKVPPTSNDEKTREETESNEAEPIVTESVKNKPVTQDEYEKIWERSQK